MRSKLRQVLRMSSACCYSPNLFKERYVSKSTDTGTADPPDISAPSSPEYVPDIEDSPFTSPCQSPAHIIELETDKLDMAKYKHEYDLEALEDLSLLYAPTETSDCSDCGSPAGSHKDFCISPSSLSPGGLTGLSDPLVWDVVSNTPKQYPWKLSLSLIETTESLDVTDKTPHLYDHCYMSSTSAQDSSDVDSGDEIDVVGLPDEKPVSPALSLTTPPLTPTTPKSRVGCVSPDQERSLLRPNLKRTASMPVVTYPSKHMRLDDKRFENKGDRSQHNQMERQRRLDIQSLFQRLKSSVPEAVNAARSSKLSVLRAATRFINSISSLSVVLERQERELKTRQIKLIRSVVKYPEGRTMLNLQQRGKSRMN